MFEKKLRNNKVRDPLIVQIVYRQLVVALTTFLAVHRSLQKFKFHKLRITSSENQSILSLLWPIYLNENNVSY